MGFTENRSHFKTIFLALIVILLGLIALTSTRGVADISWMDSLKILIHRIPILGDSISLEGIPENHITIVWKLRLPRIILAGLVGMGLAISGAAFQGMFKNPMADPYVLGVSSGASLGATLAIVLGIGGFLGQGGITVMAFIGALTTISIVYSIAKVRNKVPIVSLILAGIAVSYLLSSIISLMMIFNRTQIEKIVFWLMGSVSSAGWNQVHLLLPFTLIGSIVISLYSKDLNVMLMGDDTAKNLGVETEWVKKLLLVTTSLVVAATVSVSGIIGFVGLIVPHTVRIIIGPDNRVLIPLSALAGAIFMIISDTLARTLVAPTEIPVGAITSLFGAPYFIYLLIRSKKVS